MPRLSRRLFLAASAALAARPAVGAGTPGTAVHRRCDRRRGSGRDRRRAPDRGRRPKVRADRSRRSHRRPLHHRHAHVRRALRSRRPLDSRARFQSRDQAHGAARNRSLSGAGEPEGADRPALRARRRAGRFSGAASARQPRHRRRGAQGRRRLRAGAAERPRRLAAGGRIRAGSVRLRQGTGAGVGGGFRQIHRAQHRRVLPPGLRHADRRLRRRDCRQAVDAGDRDRHAP